MSDCETASPRPTLDELGQEVAHLTRIAHDMSVRLAAVEAVLGFAAAMALLHVGPPARPSVIDALRHTWDHSAGGVALGPDDPNRLAAEEVMNQLIDRIERFRPIAEGFEAPDGTALKPRRP